MAERYLFFNSVPVVDERIYQAQDFADYFGSVLQWGIIQEGGTVGLQATVLSGMNMSVAIGKASLAVTITKIRHRSRSLSTCRNRLPTVTTASSCVSI